MSSAKHSTSAQLITCANHRSASQLVNNLLKEGKATMQSYQAAVINPGDPACQKPSLEKQSLAPTLLVNNEEDNSFNGEQEEEEADVIRKAFDSPTKKKDHNNTTGNNGNNNNKLFLNFTIPPTPIEDEEVVLQHPAGSGSASTAEAPIYHHHLQHPTPPSKTAQLPITHSRNASTVLEFEETLQTGEEEITPVRQTGVEEKRMTFSGQKHVASHFVDSVKFVPETLEKEEQLLSEEEGKNVQVVVSPAKTPPAAIREGNGHSKTPQLIQGVMEKVLKGGNSVRKKVPYLSDDFEEEGGKKDKGKIAAAPQKSSSLEYTLRVESQNVLPPFHPEGLSKKENNAAATKNSRETEQKTAIINNNVATNKKNNEVEEEPKIGQKRKRNSKQDRPKFDVGQRIEVKWGATYHPATVVKMETNGKVLTVEWERSGSRDVVLAKDSRPLAVAATCGAAENIVSGDAAKKRKKLIDDDDDDDLHFLQDKKKTVENKNQSAAVTKNNGEVEKSGPKLQTMTKKTTSIVAAPSAKKGSKKTTVDLTQSSSSSQLSEGDDSDHETVSSSTSEETSADNSSSSDASESISSCNVEENSLRKKNLQKQGARQQKGQKNNKKGTTTTHTKKSAQKSAKKGTSSSKKTKSASKNSASKKVSVEAADSAQKNSTIKTPQTAAKLKSTLRVPSTSHIIDHPISPVRKMLNLEDDDNDDDFETHLLLKANSTTTFNGKKGVIENSEKGGKTAPSCQQKQFLQNVFLIASHETSTVARQLANEFGAKVLDHNTSAESVLEIGNYLLKTKDSDEISASSAMVMLVQNLPSLQKSANCIAGLTLGLTPIDVRWGKVCLDIKRVPSFEGYSLLHLPEKGGEMGGNTSPPRTFPLTIEQRALVGVHAVVTSSKLQELLQCAGASTVQQLKAYNAVEHGVPHYVMTLSGRKDVIPSELMSVPLVDEFWLVQLLLDHGEGKQLSITKKLMMKEVEEKRSEVEKCNVVAHDSTTNKNSNLRNETAAYDRDKWEKHRQSLASALKQTAATQLLETNLSEEQQATLQVLHGSSSLGTAAAGAQRAQRSNSGRFVSKKNSPVLPLARMETDCHFETAVVNNIDEQQTAQVTDSPPIQLNSLIQLPARRCQFVQLPPPQTKEQKQHQPHEVEVVEEVFFFPLTNLSYFQFPDNCNVSVGDDFYVQQLSNNDSKTAGEVGIVRVVGFAGYMTMNRFKSQQNKKINISSQLQEDFISGGEIPRIRVQQYVLDGLQMASGADPNSSAMMRIVGLRPPRSDSDGVLDISFTSLLPNIPLFVVEEQYFQHVYLLHSAHEEEEYEGGGIPQVDPSPFGKPVAGPRKDGTEQEEVGQDIGRSPLILSSSFSKGNEREKSGDIQWREKVLAAQNGSRTYWKSVEQCTTFEKIDNEVTLTETKEESLRLEIGSFVYFHLQPLKTTAVKKDPISVIAAGEIKAIWEETGNVVSNWAVRSKNNNATFGIELLRYEVQNDELKSTGEYMVVTPSHIKCLADVEAFSAVS